jgi:Protein of unknown function (DUF4446)
MISITTVIAAVAAFAGAVIALAIYHFAVVRPAFERLASLVGAHDDLIGGGAGASGRLDQLDARVAESRAHAERAAERVSELERMARTDVSRAGFVRYDAFDDTGSNLSYALALLNREGDGVVLTSIYSRNDTRTFGKAVTGYQPVANASEEELRAIAIARDGSPAA